MSNEIDPLFTSVFIGNTGVGKTSILSAMYMALDEANLPCGLSLLPQTEDEFQLLKGKWQEMKRHIRKQSFGATIQKPLYQGSQGFTNHDFKLTGQPSDSQDSFLLPFRIWDTKGGDTAGTNPDLIEKVVQSFSVMCAVDSTFLMECDSDVNEEMNELRSIKHILESSLAKPNNIQAVFFLLTKCEKYMKTEDGRKRMADKFNEKFHSVLELLHQKGIMVHYLPVQTMGCVELARIEECEDGSWNQEFQLVLGKNFDASDAVQPLSLLLQMTISLLDVSRQEQWEGRGLFEKLIDFLTSQEAPAPLDGLVQAISKHFGPPKDWRTNQGGKLAEVVPAT